MFFFVNITIPCWIHYGTKPAILYRRARVGDMTALESILRLDPMVQYDRLISEQIHKAWITDRRKYKRIQNWTRDASKIDWMAGKSHTAKRLASFARGYSEEVNVLSGAPPLSASELLALFDAYAQGQERATGQSDFLDTTPEGFARGLQPSRQYWYFFEKYRTEPTKKQRKRVPDKN